MIRKALYIVLVATMASCGTTRNKMGTSTADIATDGATTVTTEKKMEADGAFWGRLLSEACREMDKENICISPLSAQFAMAMVANGAEGKTKKEILDAMKLGDNANEKGRRLLDDIATKTIWNENSDVRIANSISSVTPPFLQASVNFFLSCIPFILLIIQSSSYPLARYMQ